MTSNESIYQDIIEIIDHWKHANPLACHYIGIHEFDGKIPDLSKEAITSRIAELKSDLKTLATKEKNYSEPHKKFEFNLVKLSLETELFELEKRCEYKVNPLIYVRPLGIVEGSFTKRSFAAIEKRIDIIIDFISKIPKLLGYANVWLEESLPQAKVQMSILSLTGIINYYKQSLFPFIEQSKNKGKIQHFNEVNAIAINALESFLSKIKEFYLPKSNPNFALGKEKFLEMLQKQENITIEFDKLLAIGEKDLERNYSAMKAILEKHGGDSYLENLFDDTPKPSELIEYAKSTLDRTMNFVIDKDIVTVPTTDQCNVIETPESQRKFAFAAMNTPGALEVPEAAEAYYYVTPVDPTWDEEQTKNFLKMFNKTSFEMITVHEVWPGHYLQLVYDRKFNSSLIVKMFADSYSMVEGYAHYTEEMVFEQGYDPFNDRDKLHVGQLLEALARNVRYISAIKMHCMGMTVEESKQMFKEKAFLSEENAQVEATRGTVDPMYLNYTLGKLLIMKLREDFKKEQKENYSIKLFHDKLLKLGSAPITILRSMMLEDPSGEII